jgi:hypothetical protein
VSASPTQKFGSRSDAKAAGWFSRRHQTNEAHEAAKAQKIEKAEEQGLSVLWTKKRKAVQS